MRRKKSIRRRKSMRRRESSFDNGMLTDMLSNVLDLFSPTTETDIEETKIKNKQIEQLRKNYKEIETNLNKILQKDVWEKDTRKDVWKKTVDILRNTEIIIHSEDDKSTSIEKIKPPPEDYLWNRDNVARINWYITQIPQKSITDLVAKILSKANP